MLRPHLAADLTGLEGDPRYISSTGDHMEEMMKRVAGNVTPRPAPSQSARRRRRRHLSRRYEQAALRAERAARRGPPAAATPDEAYARLPVQDP